MDGNKLELTGKPTADPPPASYRAIPEVDMEEEAVTRPKSLVKSKPASPEADGADEKMLPKDEVKVNPAAEKEKQNGDAKLDIGELREAFVGLTKEELMKYATDPFWVRLRWFLFIAFWILWGLMLLGAIMIILAAPKCDPPPPRTWWEKGPLAEIKQGSNEEIDKLKDLGVTGVIVPWREDAYASLDETHKFIKTVKQYKDNNINVIVELEPGHSNVWFNKSQYRDPEFADYYIWLPPKDMSNGEGPKPPNNWVSTKNSSAWIYSDKRNEYYYAPTGVPHLNFRNPNVTARFSDVIKTFLRLGIGGVRLKGAPNLLVDAKFTDEGHVQNPGDCVLTDYCFFTHTQTENLNDLGPLLKQWKTVVKNNTDNGPFMISDDLSNNIEAYKVNSSYVVDLPLQSHLFFKPNLINIVHVVNTTFNANNITWPLWRANSTSEWDIVTYLLPGTPLVTADALDNKEVLKVRDMPSIMRGSFDLYTPKDTIFAFTRVTAGNPGILVAFNPTENRTVVNFPDFIKEVSEEVRVLLYSKNYNETGVSVGVNHESNSMPLSPNSAIVLSYVPKAK